jgi:nucleotide-binding universal stress UspA family protein
MTGTHLDDRPAGSVPRGRAVVVVGVDGSNASDAALRWAAREATARRAPLEVLMAWDATGPSARWDLEAVPFDGAAANQALLQQVRELLGEPVPHHVRLRAFDDVAAPALVEAAGDRHLLVVGARGHSRPHPVQLGSVAELVVRHARGDVVVVPEDVEQRGGRFVVGVDGSTASATALRWAVAEARRWSAHLDAVIAYDPAGAPTRSCTRPTTDVREAAGVALEREIARALGEDGSGDVEIDRVVLAGRPSNVLLARARASSLLVVGRRGAGGFDDLGLGSVALECARRTGSPIAIVRTPCTPSGGP